MTLSGLFSQSLSLNPAIDSNFLLVEGDTPITEVLGMMSRLWSHCTLDKKDEIYAYENFNLNSQTNNYNILLKEKPISSCVLITQNNTLIGIFTERDMVGLTANNIPLDNLKIRDVIAIAPITLQYSDGLNVFNALSILHQHKIRHLPIVNQENHPIGIITHESIRKSLQPVNLLTRIYYVKDVMTTNVIAATRSYSLLTVAQLMINHKISSVLIIEEKDNKKFPLGIITEKDIVQFNAMKLDLANTQAKDVMSFPVFCLSPDASLWDASKMMNEQRIRRLVITESTGELLGIVSQSNLLKVLNPSDMYGVIEILQNVIEEKTENLERTNQYLRQEILKREKAEQNIIITHQRLQNNIEKRTQELLETNQKLQQDITEKEKIEKELRESQAKLTAQTEELKETLHTLQNTQLKLIQTEKMSSVGQLVAGIAHEINNPINFIYGNISYAEQYVNELVELVDLYHKHYPNPTLEIEEKHQEIELDFLKEDLNKLLKSMKIGAERIRDLVVSLRNFSRLNESQMKLVNIHEGLDNTLLILQNQLILKGSHQGIQVMKEYAHLSEIECYPGQLNQVFMNIITNAIDSLQEAFAQEDIKPITIQAQQFNFPIIFIKTEESTDKNYVLIRIIDNGKGLSEDIQQNLFNPFFTTKPVGKGTGLGLSISYQLITEKHKGSLECSSSEQKGTEFIIKIPKSQTHQVMWPL
jgi:two-component system, NtrC family, sensor kinase